MSLPKPKTELGDHCSTIFNNTLYVFSSTAFQSISLSSGAEWETLPEGVGTKGAECVHAHRNTPREALYIVGGTTTGTTVNGFMGLQRYLFNNRKWETISLLVPVTFNLTNHGATFLERSQQIFVFSGTTWPETTTPSANTFLIKTVAPYEITAITAAHPLLAPLVLPWGDGAALIVGGDENNRELRIFNPETGWWTLAVSLEEGLPAKGKAGVSLMEGDDGSRMLYAFDLTNGPTAVTQLLVNDQGATPSICRRQTTTSATALTASTWPAYNNTLAPKLSMGGISVAYDSDTVVISPADDTNPIAIFDARKNSWVNTTELFGTENISTKSVNFSTEPSVSPSRISSAKPSESSGAEASGLSGLNTNQTLSLVLGIVLGIAVAVAFALIFIKYRRKRVGAQLGSRCMSFQDRGELFIPEAISYQPPRPPRAAIDSWTSKDGEKHTSPVARAFNTDGDSIVSTVGVRYVPSGEKESATTEDSNSHARGSGWSKYFSGADATNLAMPPRTYARSPHSSIYTDLSISFPTLKGHMREGNIGAGVATAGIATASSGTMEYGERSSNLQRSVSKGLILQDPGVGVHSPSGQRRNSNETVYSNVYPSGVPESLISDNNMLGWSLVDGRGTLVSSVYTECPSEQIPGLDLGKRDMDTGGEDVGSGQSVDSLGWLDLR